VAARIIVGERLFVTVKVRAGTIAARDVLSITSELGTMAEERCLRGEELAVLECRVLNHLMPTKEALDERKFEAAL
jgi:hypothetical protein